jgi:uncharacterized protein YndB with AHSA1/START domain
MIAADIGKAPLERELVIARTLEASREVVFAAWSDPRRAVQWSAPSTIRAHTSKWTPGRWGLAYPSALDGGGPDLWQGGVFREVVLSERLVSTFAWRKRVSAA